MSSIRLALKYIRYHRLKTMILVACIFLTALLPVAIEILLTQFERGIVARAEATPLVVGPRGSRFDLTLRSLYFQLGESENEDAGTIQYGQVADIELSGWARAIPLHSKFTARGFPVVGTTLEYFRFRGLRVTGGDSLVQIGDAVIGAEVARSLGIAPGDPLLTDMESVVSLSAYPMKLHVRGVLAETNSPDDRAVFVDLKTAWIIDGIGHGHQDLEDADEDQLLARDANRIVASAAVLSYVEINEQNINSFHFHGDPTSFPITSIIAIPPDEKSETIMIGRYRDAHAPEQLVVPSIVINDLMGLVFQVKRFFDANAILIAISTLLLLVLIVLLSMRLREREMQTMFKIGASRHTMALLQVAEFSIILLFSAGLVSVAVIAIRWYAGDIVQSILLAG